MTAPAYFDCPRCGHLGALGELVDHPTRPMPQDIGFCPKCGSDIDYPITEPELRHLVAAEYGEDPEIVLAEIRARICDSDGSPEGQDATRPDGKAATARAGTASPEGPSHVG